LAALPHNSMRYVHTGFNNVLYMRSLFSSDKGECFPTSQDISRVWWSRCFHFVATWSFHVRRLSKCSPRYLNASTWGTTVWLMYTGGQCPRRRVNVMCEDLVSLIFSRQFRVQSSTRCRWSCRLTEANTGSVWVVKMAAIEGCEWFAACSLCLWTVITRHYDSFIVIPSDCQTTKKHTTVEKRTLKH
jgi:hypothetical protein